MIMYPCGCIAIELPNYPDKVILLMSCYGGEHDGAYYGFNLQDKSRFRDPERAVPLSIVNQEEVIHQIRQLVGQGYKFRDLKDALRD